MRILLSHLLEFLPECTKTSTELADILTISGIEVEKMEEICPNFEGVVFAKVVHVEPHPNAQKLVVAKVNDGKDEYTVVCGAPNCRTGLITAFAKIGARLSIGTKEEFAIKKAVLRGVESFGMLCAETELGIGKDDNGICEFSDHTLIGKDVQKHFSEIAFDIAVTPNLGHALSVMGVAREVSALLNIPFKKLEVHTYKNILSEVPKANYIQPSLFDRDTVLRYTAMQVNAGVNKSSPLWLRRRLDLCGFSPKSLYIDITNYIMLECGQPMHAFDADAIGNGLHVRKSQKDEQINLLDSSQKQLSNDIVVIASDKGALACAGVMGGASSAVNNETKEVVFEAACFPSTVIRQASKKLGITSESSRRFERGIDIEYVFEAQKRALQLLESITSQVIVKNIYDYYPNPSPEKVLTITKSKIEKVLGYELAVGDIEAIFKQLSFSYTTKDYEQFNVHIPSYRNDMHEDVDIIEEFVRVMGMHVKETTHLAESHPIIQHDHIYILEQELRKRILTFGLQEVVTCNLIGPRMTDVILDEVVPRENFVVVQNPLSQEQSILRASLLPGMLEVIKKNAQHRIFDLACFEIGNIHFQENRGYKEQLMCAILLSGVAGTHHFTKTEREWDFFDLKGMIEATFSSLGYENMRFERSHLSILHPGRQAKIYIGEIHIGMIGEIHPEIVRINDGQGKHYFAEFDVQVLLSMKAKKTLMQALALFPASDRDLTITLDESVNYIDIMQQINQLKSKILEDVLLVDIFRDKKIGENKKNVTIRFIYRDMYKTLAQEEVDQEHMRISMHLQTTVGSQVI